MLKNTVKIFLVAILLSLSLTAFFVDKKNEIYAQTFTPEQQAQLDKALEEVKILQEQALKDAQEEAEENLYQVQESIDESPEDFEEGFDSYPMPEPKIDISRPLGGLLGGALLTTSTIFFFVILGLLLAFGGLILNIVMLIDCSNREFNDKSLWMAVLIAGMLMGWGLIPGVLYYFLVKKKLGPIEKKEESK